MADNQLESMVRESLHAMRAYLSPIKTFLELERQGLAMPERDALVIQAGKSVDLISTEIERLSVNLKKGK